MALVRYTAPQFQLSRPHHVGMIGAPQGHCTSQVALSKNDVKLGHEPTTTISTTTNTTTTTRTELSGLCQHLLCMTKAPI